MSQAIVEQILEQIDALSEEDQALLERQLTERFETIWRKETAEARLQATARGVDQATIDAAISRHRYGS